tara:strand:- start:2712 stop:3824 length:1113 start_codon:yes stop_codon:yes gene_type:complete
MSRILRRPMFRGGQVESKDDLKVIDQMGIAKLAQGGRVGYAAGDVVDIYESMSEKIPMPEKRKRRPLSTGDYLRIASAGLDILGAPSEGSGIGGALRTAAGPLSKLGVGLAGSMDARTAADEETYQKLVDARNDKILGLTGVQVEKDVGMERARGEFARKEIAFNTLTETKRETIKNNIDLTDAEKKLQLSDLDKKANEDYEFFIIKGGDVSDFYKLGSQTELIKTASKAADKALRARYGSKYKSRPTYAEEKAREQAKFQALLVKEFGMQFAEGGPVAMTEDVNMMEATPSGMTDLNVEETMETPQSQLPQLTYDELRARLPAEIGNEIVTLLASSSEALAMFAEIRTQADVDAFNQQFQVQLVLPQEA